MHRQSCMEVEWLCSINLLHPYLTEARRGEKEKEAARPRGFASGTESGKEPPFWDMQGQP